VEPKASQRLIRIAEVERKVGLKRSSIYEDPTFPKRVPIGARASAWVEEEVDAWIAARIAARTQEAEARSERGRKLAGAKRAKLEAAPA
jgi:prophage regulatory protein